MEAYITAWKLPLGASSQAARTKWRIPPFQQPGTTPEDLISGGLYGPIATAFHKEPHRQISMAGVAKALGAVEKKRQGDAKARLLEASRSLRSKNSSTMVAEVSAAEPKSTV